MVRKKDKRDARIGRVHINSSVAFFFVLDVEEKDGACETALPK